MARGGIVIIHRTRIILFYLFIGSAAFIPLLAAASPPEVISSAAAVDIDQLFEQSEGWIGGDGGNSVILPSKRIVWLFSDTWVGNVQDGRRGDATMVNNTIGVQENPESNVRYFIHRGQDGTPTAAIVPADGRGWYWIQSGLMDGKKLLMFLSQIEKSGNDGVFNFRSTGLWLGTVANAEEAVETWNVTQVQMPNTIFTDERILVWGATTVRVDDDIFVFGTDEICAKMFPKRSMILARVPAKSLMDFSTWKYFHNGQWVEDFHECSPLANDLATEFSVTPFEKGYLAVYTHQGFSPKIMGRTATQPWGPWSDPVVLYTSPEMTRDKNLFCYGAKAHPALSKDHEVLISYFVNSLDVAQVLREPDLYWPRFVRVKLAAKE